VRASLGAPDRSARAKPDPVPPPERAPTCNGSRRSPGASCRDGSPSPRFGSSAEFGHGFAGRGQGRGFSRVGGRRLRRRPVRASPGAPDRSARAKPDPEPAPERAPTCNGSRRSPGASCRDGSPSPRFGSSAEFGHGFAGRAGKGAGSVEWAGGDCVEGSCGRPSAPLTAAPGPSPSPSPRPRQNALQPATARGGARAPHAATARPALASARAPNSGTASPGAGAGKGAGSVEWAGGLGAYPRSRP
jgi:hypothetical protein